jgi:hypothetical protein
MVRTPCDWGVRPVETPRGNACRALLVCGLMATLILVLAPTAALGANRIYWGNANKISFANLNGSGGANLATPGVTYDGAQGIALDPAAGNIYWGNGGTIYYAKLNGSGGSGLASGIDVDGVWGLAFDPAAGTAGTLYWGNYPDSTIGYFDQGANSVGLVDTTGATIGHPEGLVVDPGPNVLYWSNFDSGPPIGYHSISGSGGGDLDTTGATTVAPLGLAIDPDTARIYWANGGISGVGEGISFADLGGGGGDDLSTNGATVNTPEGVAIDSDGGRIYWANVNGDKISYAALDGSGGANLPTAGATVNSPAYVAILKAPKAGAAPQITGGTNVGATLSCSQGTWAPDLIQSFLYRAPHTFTYQWSRNGNDISGATSSTLNTHLTGDYRCQVTARNVAGSASQISDVHVISGSPPPPPPPGTVIHKAIVKPRKHKARFEFDGTGRFTGFECKLHRESSVSKRARFKSYKRGRFKSCSSPKVYRGLDAGHYLFKVRAVGPGGADPTPAKDRFRIR